MGVQDDADANVARTGAFGAAEEEGDAHVPSAPPAVAKPPTRRGSAVAAATTSIFEIGRSKPGAAADARLIEAAAAHSASARAAER